MSAANIPFSKTGGVSTALSPESQKDLEDVLDETVSPQEKWVEENRSDLFRAFATGRKADLSPYKNIEVLVAVEGTEKDLRHTLVSILILAPCKTLGAIQADARYRTLYTRDTAR